MVLIKSSVALEFGLSADSMQIVQWKKIVVRERGFSNSGLFRAFQTFPTINLDVEFYVSTLVRTVDLYTSFVGSGETDVREFVTGSINVASSLTMFTSFDPRVLMMYTRCGIRVRFSNLKRLISTSRKDAMLSLAVRMYQAEIHVWLPNPTESVRARGSKNRHVSGQ
jgi:hypothetical protein